MGDVSEKQPPLGHLALGIPCLSHPEEAKPLQPGRHWYLLVAPCGGPQLLDVLC